MSLSGKNILIILGGMYHDFDGFTQAMTPLLQEAGCQVQASYDLDCLLRLETMGTDIVLSYTSLSLHREEKDTWLDQMTVPQVQGLHDWVRRGGGLMAAHSATVMGKSDPDLGRLMGGVFVTHPPQFAFTVYPMFGEHPITVGIEAFTVHDEFYMERLADRVDIHMAAFDRGIAYPMVWSKAEGQGRVAHVAMGHDEKVWNLPSYRRLMLQAMDWVVSREA